MIVTLNQCVLTKNGKENVRRTVERNMTNFEKLDKLVPQYGANKALMENYKKQCEEENKEIKQIMSDLVLQHYTAGGYKISKSVQTKENLDEDILLDIIKNNSSVINTERLIKTKEYVDMDELEKALYNNEIPKEVILDMDKARTVKKVTTLRITKLKENK